MTFLTKVARIAATVTLAMPLALSAAQAETTLTIGVKSDRYSVKECESACKSDPLGWVMII